MKKCFYGAFFGGSFLFSTDMLLNVHSHFPGKKGEYVIQSLWEHYEKVREAGLFSLGVHPRYIVEDASGQLEQLRIWAGHSSVMAIGECGLDRRYPTDLKKQSDVFFAQVLLAAEFRKPLVIHCVRAWEEVFHLLGRASFSFPVIFHGFNKGPSIARRIIESGYYLSIGQWIEKARIRELLKEIPLERLFLETDAVAVPIESIYEMAAASYHMPLPSFSTQIMNNGLRVFGEKLLSV